MSLEVFENVVARWLPLSNDEADGTPGVQVVVVSSGGVVFSGARGLADPLSINKSKELVTTHHQANMYSVTKFFSACCILKLVDQGKLSLSTRARGVLPEPMRDFVNDCTIEQLVTHTASAPNPLPLRWVHGVDDQVDEETFLLDVLRKNPFPKNISGAYGYSNVGYWILGAVIAHVCKRPMSDFAQICDELLFEGILSQSVRKEFGTTFANDKPTAVGYVARWSLLALVASWLLPSWILGKSSNSWTRMELHHLNGAAFGGIVSTSHAVATFLQCILMGTVLSLESLKLLLAPQVPEMTMGLHIRSHDGMPVYHKEGGGAGCHSSIHFRPHQDLAACVIAGDARFDVNGLLDEMLDVAAANNDKKEPLTVASETKYVKASDQSELYTKSYKSLDEKQKPVCKEPMLLIHGGPGVPDYLEPLANKLIESGLASLVITFDQRGVGKSNDALMTDLSMDLVVNDIDSIREAYQAKQLHLLGHSWGGVLARLYASSHPSHVSSLVLLSPSAVSEASQWSTMETQVMKSNLRKCGWLSFMAMGLYSLLMLLPLSIIANGAARKLLAQVMKNYYFDPATAPQPPPWFLSGVSAKACFAYKEAFLRDVTQPIKVPQSIPSVAVFGDRDIYGSDLVQKFSQVHDVKMIWNAGHLTWVDRPRALTGVLRDFLSKVV